MGTGLIELDIWNAALDLLSQSRVVTDAEKTANSTPDARFFKRNYKRVVQSELRKNIWSFAKDAAEIEADATAPAFDYQYRYAMPDGWLRLLPLTEYGAKGGALVPFEMYGRFIHTNESGPLRARGIQDIQDPDLWDAVFVDVIVARLAMEYAHKLTGKVDYYSKAKDAYVDAVTTAMMVDAIEDYAEPVEAHDILRVRG